MEFPVNQELISQLDAYTLAGGLSLFDLRPEWKDSKFILYPYQIKQINNKESILYFQNKKYHFVNQSDFKRIKSIYRLMFFVDKIEVN
jgi:hypothetical protein